ncbi:four helix bundle suffix domain-containing protein [Patescibacteria group bacterium]|nr:four helix bundle suffix domain-containing protein [Patescibacteria group bacterium]
MKKILTTSGNYRELKSFQMSTIIYDFTVEFCNKYVNEYRMRDQMVQAARSGRQNIAEGCKASCTSSKAEMKLINVARASLEELLLDYEDYLRQHKLSVWGKEAVNTKTVRNLAYSPNKTYQTYESYIHNPENAANTAICLIHQATYLLRRQLLALEQQFLENGGFTERLYHASKQSI